MNMQDSHGSRPLTVDEAMHAVVAVVQRFGLPTDDMAVLHATNNVVIHLRPAALLAKTSRSRAAAEKELAVALHCAGLGAPVAAPAGDVPVCCYRHDGLTVTLWRHYAAAETVPRPGECGAALLSLHAALRSLPGDVPALRARFDAVADIATDDAQMIALDPEHLAGLRTALGALTQRVTGALDAHADVLHGEPHSGNVLRTQFGVRFCDFEDVCRGPVEWDLAFLPEGELRAYGNPFEPALVDAFRAVISAQVAVLCWAKLRTLDDPSERQHAQHHLQRALSSAAGADGAPI